MPEIKTAQEIINIIEPISPDLFQIDYFGYTPEAPDCENNGEEDNGKSCFLGHIHRHFKPEERRAFGDNCGYGARALTAKFLREQHNSLENGAGVNNKNTINGYTEPVIKNRVMHMLKDMVAAGY